MDDIKDNFRMWGDDGMFYCIPKAECSAATRYSVKRLTAPVLHVMDKDSFLDWVIDDPNDHSDVGIYEAATVKNSIANDLKTHASVYKYKQNGTSIYTIDKKQDAFCVTDTDTTSATHYWVSWLEWAHTDLLPKFNCDEYSVDKYPLGPIQTVPVVDTFLPIPIPPAGGIIPDDGGGGGGGGGDDDSSDYPEPSSEPMPGQSSSSDRPGHSSSSDKPGQSSSQSKSSSSSGKKSSSNSSSFDEPLEPGWYVHIYCQDTVANAVARVENRSDDSSDSNESSDIDKDIIPCKKYSQHYIDNNEWSGVHTKCSQGWYGLVYGPYDNKEDTLDALISEGLKEKIENSDGSYIIVDKCVECTANTYVANVCENNRETLIPVTFTDEEIANTTIGLLDLYNKKTDPAWNTAIAIYSADGDNYQQTNYDADYTSNYIKCHPKICYSVDGKQVPCCCTRGAKAYVYETSDPSDDHTDLWGYISCVNGVTVGYGREGEGTYGGQSILPSWDDYFMEMQNNAKCNGDRCSYITHNGGYPNTAEGNKQLQEWIDTYVGKECGCREPVQPTKSAYLIDLDEALI